MPKHRGYAMKKGASYGARRRSKKRPAGRQPAAPGVERVSPQKNIATGSTMSSPEVRSRTQQVAPDYIYVRSDLTRIGIAGGAMLLILAILSLVL